MTMLPPMMIPAALAIQHLRHAFILRSCERSLQYAMNEAVSITKRANSTSTDIRAPYSVSDRDGWQVWCEVGGRKSSCRQTMKSAARPEGSPHRKRPNTRWGEPSGRAVLEGRTHLGRHASARAFPNVWHRPFPGTAAPTAGRRNTVRDAKPIHHRWSFRFPSRSTATHPGR